MKIAKCRLVTALVISHCVPSDAVFGQHLRPEIITPKLALMDEVVPIRASGLVAGKHYRIRVSTIDSAGSTWTAAATFTADAKGRIDVTRDAPIDNSYTGVDPMALVTAMTPESRDSLKRFVPPATDDHLLRIELLYNQRTLDSANVIRRFRARQIAARPIRADDVTGTLFEDTTSDRSRPALIVLGGSEGGEGGRDVAAQLANRGFVTLSLAYFGVEGTPAELDEIPIDNLSKAIDYLQKNSRVKPDRIGIVASSKGAEAALLLAANDKRIKALVVYAPSSVAWSCICRFPGHSSWKLAGQPLPSVPPGRDTSIKVAPGQPQRPSVQYQFRLKSLARPDAVIPVERIEAPIMSIAGEQDQLWPSAVMARQLQTRRRTAAPRGDEFLFFNDAGHLIGKSYLPAGTVRVAGGRIDTGGSVRANALAQADAWPRVISFLQRALAN